MRGIDCKPIIGTKDAMLLAECPVPGVLNSDEEVKDPPEAENEAEAGDEDKGGDE